MFSMCSELTPRAHIPDIPGYHNLCSPGFYRALLDASNALNPEGYDYLHYLILSGWQLVKSVALPANPVVHAKISGELFDYMCVHSLEHVSTQVNGM